ncbi:MAG: bifunctional DNA-binding transcriptional regulator/O6-methylguanine-DNA methyltransferase Ada [Mesorhizobium amorphae]|nr:MAG: bifunctional DNA-binding transcriptional regulator/O6-methylguanine-DNA methyltransferase Ada [Mesorhizobium amorphae]
MDQPMTDPQARWAAVAARDARADGSFVYGVTTTGVYCRPSCPSRPARPENLRFFADNAEAKRAGFRPCLRCTPDGPSQSERDVSRIARACRILEDTPEPPLLEELATRVGLSASRFHRLFKAATGLTPKAYGAAEQAKRMRAALADSSATVTDAIYAAGFTSNSRFYESAAKRLGVKPASLRKGAAGSTIRFAVGQSSLGAVLVAQSARGVCAILLCDDPEALVRDLQDRFPQAELQPGDAGFEQVVAEVVGLVEDPHRGHGLPLDIQGTAFQERVWRALVAIPAGETVSYAELAARIGAPSATRAVAGACAANPLAVAVPCHRVVRNDGALSGYRWGVDRKRALLLKEQRSG